MIGEIGSGLDVVVCSGSTAVSNSSETGVGNSCLPDALGLPAPGEHASSPGENGAAEEGHSTAAVYTSSAENNNDNNNNGSVSNNNSTTSSSSDGLNNSNTYDDLFPSLPSGPPGGPGGNPIGEWNKKPKLPSSFVTQVFRVPTEERKEMGSGGFGGDESLKILKSVSSSSGAKVEMSSSKDNSLAFLLTGKPEAVLKAKKELLQSFQTQSVNSLPVPKEHHRAILGKGGSKKAEIEDRTGTKIKVPGIGEDSDTILVSGTREAVTKAMAEIKSISEEQSRHAMEVLTIPKIYHPFINGPNGETVKALGAAHPHVKISVPPPSVQKDDIYVAGDKDGVAAIVERIKEIYKDIEKRAGTVSVEVRKPQHKYIFGPKGQTLNDILAETGVFVEVPPTDSNSDTITLRGPQEKLGTALNKVYEKANSVVSLRVPCPSWLHKYIIGRKGSSIQKLKGELPKVHIEFLDYEGQIKIEGPPEDSESARSALEAQVSSLQQSLSFAEVSVDPKYHKYIIGKNGATVNKLKCGSPELSITIPEAPGAPIRIEGPPEAVARSSEELQSLVDRVSSEKELTLDIEPRFHRSLIGHKGERIQRLRADYPEVQINFPELGKPSGAVRLRGPPKDVEAVGALLTEAAGSLSEASYQVRVPLYKEFHKYVVGKGGASIRKLRAETEVRVDIPDAGESSELITLTGRKPQVEIALQRLLSMQAEMQNVVSESLVIPSRIHNSLIGSGGKLVQSISEDCGGVSITFPPPGGSSDEVGLRGPKEDVVKAKKMLLELSESRLAYSHSETVRADPAHHKFLIGRGGATIAALRERSGAKIIFPSDKDEEKDLITIIGTKDSVSKAVSELKARIADLDLIIEDSISVDPRFHRHFVTRRGEVLRQISEEFGGVSVSFPRGSGSGSEEEAAAYKVSLKGSKDCVEGAKARIAEIVAALALEVSVSVHIPSEHHRALMGPRGSQVQKLCGDFGVNIKFPERESCSESPIVISGRKEAVSAAEEALRALVPITLDVPVPYEFHRFIIGSKGASVRSLMVEHGVNISVPPSELEADSIAVTGPKANAEEAAEALKARVEAFLAEKAEKAKKSFEAVLEVSSEFHPKIIGRKGAVISGLRSQFDVLISLPRKEDRGESGGRIVITGSEEGVAAAKEAILALVEDAQAAIKEELRIDPRVHSKIIGRRGAGIRKIMADFGVDVRLPREGETEVDLVVVSGKEENVLDAKDHLYNLEEEYLQDLQENDWMDDYIKPGSVEAGAKVEARPSRGFEVAQGAPWHGASEEAFPSLGNTGDPSSHVPPASGPLNTPAWGPRRL